MTHHNDVGDLYIGDRVRWFGMDGSEHTGTVETASPREEFGMVLVRPDGIGQRAGWIDQYKLERV